MSLQGRAHSEMNLRGHISVPGTIQTETAQIAALEGSVKEWADYQPADEEAAD